MKIFKVTKKISQMQSNNKLFEIDEYDLQDDKILVYLFKKGKQEIVTIPRAKYEEWLSDSSRLDWVTDNVNYCGEHDQQTGTLAIDIYWTGIFDVTPDLYDWIVLKMVAEDVFDIQTPLANILGGHFYDSLTTISSPEKIAL